MVRRGRHNERCTNHSLAVPLLTSTVVHTECIVAMMNRVEPTSQIVPSPKPRHGCRTRQSSTQCRATRVVRRFPTPSALSCRDRGWGPCRHWYHDGRRHWYHQVMQQRMPVSSRLHEWLLLDTPDIVGTERPRHHCRLRTDSYHGSSQSGLDRQLPVQPIFQRCHIQ